MKRAFIALALAAALPMSATAAERSYSFVELDYVHLNSNADGFGLRGAVEFGESGVYGLAGYNSIDVDAGIFSFDADAWELGVGYKHQISDNLDWLAEAAYAEADAVGTSIDGYRVSTGLRGNMSENFEGLIKANYLDSNGGDGDFSVTLGGQYKFSETWGAVGEVEFADGDETFLVGVRASF